jgi:electron transport complex protein RnfA
VLHVAVGLRWVHAMNELILILPCAALVALLLLRGDHSRLPALGASSALLLVIAPPLAWLLQHQLLAPLALTHLQLFGLLPLLAGLAWLALRLLSRLSQWPSQGLWLALIGNGAALACSLLAMRSPMAFGQALLLGALAAPGFWLALQLLADLQQRIDIAQVPAPFRGVPLMLINAGLLSLALVGLGSWGSA